MRGTVSAMHCMAACDVPKLIGKPLLVYMREFGLQLWLVRGADVLSIAHYVNGVRCGMGWLAPEKCPKCSQLFFAHSLS